MEYISLKLSQEENVVLELSTSGLSTSPRTTIPSSVADNREKQGKRR